VLAFAIARDSPTDVGLDPVHGVDSPGPSSLGGVRRNAPAVLTDPETPARWDGLWGIPFLVQVYSLSATYAQTFTLLASAGVLLVPPAVGAVSDRRGSRTRLIVVGMTVYTAAFAVVAALPRPPLVVVGPVFVAAAVLVGAYAHTDAVVKDRHATAASGASTGTIKRWRSPVPQSCRRR